jgi:hypothetical protein
MPQGPKEMEKALQDFVDCIDATGGVMSDDKGNPVPVADEDWIDLGVAYMGACLVLGREPRVQE